MTARPEFVERILAPLSPEARGAAERYAEKYLAGKGGLFLEDDGAVGRVWEACRDQALEDDVRAVLVGPPLDVKANSPPNRILLASVGAADLLRTQIPEPPSIIGRGVLSEGDLGTLIGAGGAGKSQLGVQLGVARSVGGHWLGLATSKGRTGLLMLELDAGAWQRRIAAAAATICPDAGEDVLNALRLVCRPNLGGLLDLNTPEGIAELAAWIRGEGLTLAIIDPVQRTHGLDENKASEMSALFQRLDALRLETGCAVLLSHHSRKSQQGSRDNDSDAASGSRVFRDFPSFNARLAVKSAGMRLLTFTKTSRAAEPAPIWLHQRPDGFLEVAENPTKTGDKNRAKVLDALRKVGADGGANVSVVSKEAGLKESATRKHLGKLEEQGLARRTGDSKTTLWWPVAEEGSGDD